MAVHTAVQMLRIAKLKRMLEKYKEHLIASPFLQTMKVVVIIMFAVHLLSCMWYLAGVNDQVLDNGHLITGWVNLQPWNETVCVAAGNTTVDFDPESCKIAVSERYLTSMYLVLNALENGNTSNEMLTAVFGELLLMFIYGAMVRPPTPQPPPCHPPPPGGRGAALSRSAAGVCCVCVAGRADVDGDARKVCGRAGDRRQAQGATPPPFPADLRPRCCPIAAAGLRISMLTASLC